MSGLDLSEDDDEFDPETDDFVHECQIKGRTYKHFDLPVREARREYDFSTEIRPHRFLPLLAFTDERRRVVLDESGKQETKTKERPIKFASHEDSAYLQAYAEWFGQMYENSLIGEGMTNCVLAYRRGGRTNIHHAKSLFDEIRTRENCNVLAIDISGFFDTLNHKHLRIQLADLLGTSWLLGHHWTIYRNITKYSWVELSDLERVLGKRRKRLGRVCSPHDFVAHVRGQKLGLVQTSALPYGIPQGTPVSGLYANIYLRSFDRALLTLVGAFGGSYRRYSDDIALVLPSDIEPREIVHVVAKILADFDLCLSEDKTDVSHFSGPTLSCDNAIQYLGFTFDGSNTLIRESSLNAYRKKMSAGIHAKLVAAKQKKIPSHKVYRREALSRYTHLGKRRNFIRYAYRAADILEAPEIKQQVKNHGTWFQRSWDKEITKVYGGLVTAA